MFLMKWLFPCQHKTAVAVTYLGEHSLTSANPDGFIMDVTCECGWGRRHYIPLPELTTYREMATRSLRDAVRLSLIEQFGNGFSTHPSHATE